ncbi:hypothetical protein GEMRC1_006023 [Eukaryota sp. GEM-RC1]
MTENEGSIYFDIHVTYFDSYFSFNLVRDIVPTPLFSYISDHVFSAKFPILLEFQIFSNYLTSSFIQIDPPIDAFNISLSTVETDNTIQYSYTINLSNASFPLGLSNYSIVWSHEGFHSYIIETISVFNLSFESECFLSVYEARPVTLRSITIVPSVDFLCEIDGTFFSSTVSKESLECHDVLIATFQQHVTLSVYAYNTLITSTLVSGESFLDEVCFTSFGTDSWPLLNDSLISISEKGLEFQYLDVQKIFDGERCCARAIEECSLLLKIGEHMVYKFENDHDIIRIRITVNSSCGSVIDDVPFSVSTANTDTFSESLSFVCTQIPSGFEFAKICESNDVVFSVSQVNLSAKNPFHLLEVEFYGFSSEECFSPVDIGLGRTFSGELVNVNVSIGYDNKEFISFSTLEGYLNSTRNGTFQGSLTVSVLLQSDECHNGEVLFNHLILPRSPVFIEPLETTFELSPGTLNITTELLCTDPIGFLVDCNCSSLSINTSLDYSQVFFHNNTATFELQPEFKFGQHQFLISLGENEFLWNFSILQKSDQIFTCLIIDVQPCKSSNDFHYSCAKVSFSAFLVYIHPTHNVTLDLYFTDLFWSLEHSFLIRVINDRSFELVGPPLVHAELIVTFKQFKTVLNIQIPNCPSPKLRDGLNCYCHSGYELSNSGECSPCLTNFYSDHQFSSICRECPYPRLTLKPGASSIEDCVCPKFSLDRNKSCEQCPKIAECSYGNLKFLLEGYKDDVRLGTVKECGIWFNCRRNECRLTNAVGDTCQFCDIKSYGRFLCLQRSDLTIGVIVLIFFLTVGFFCDKLLLRYLSRGRDSRYLLIVPHNTPKLLGKFRKFQLFIKVNPVLISMFLPSFLFSARITDTKVFVDYMSTVFVFDTFILSPLILFLIMSCISRHLIKKKHDCNFSKQHTVFF